MEAALTLRERRYKALIIVVSAIVIALLLMPSLQTVASELGGYLTEKLIGTGVNTQFVIGGTSTSMLDVGMAGEGAPPAAASFGWELIEQFVPLVLALGAVVAAFGIARGNYKMALTGTVGAILAYVIVRAMIEALS